MSAVDELTLELEQAYAEIARLRAENARLRANDDSELLTLTEIADATGLTERALKARIGKGELRGVALTTTDFRVKRSDYETWLDTMMTIGENKDGRTRQPDQLQGINHDTEENSASRNLPAPGRKIQARYEREVSEDGKAQARSQDARLTHDSRPSTGAEGSSQAPNSTRRKGGPKTATDYRRRLRNSKLVASQGHEAQTADS